MKVEFKGGKDLEAALRELGNKALAKRVVERALRLAAEPIRNEAVNLAPDDTATGDPISLKSAIKIGKKATTRGLRNFRRSEQGKDTAEVWIGIDPSVRPPRDSKSKRNKRGTRFLQSGGGVAAYSMFMEFGTGTHQAQPYMRPAWEGKKMEAFNRLADDLRSEIDKAAARAARKAARAAK